MTKYTRVDYMYRDASNYKFHGNFVVEGSLDRTDLESYLFDCEFFVPHEIGLDRLLDMPMNQDDHFLHTLESFSDVHDGVALCDSETLVIRFTLASERGWFSSFKRS